ncbi:MAG: L-threonylcarbamoyladenylate synthase, partial [Bacillota bacterium]|nr:L-threonylcarbamoyladenylate synthase [Bacillota bacterium]
KSIYVAKGRPSDNPLILHITCMEDAAKVAYLNEKSIKMAEVFWPGPLTMVLPKKDIVSQTVTGGLHTVAIRMPSNDIARKLIHASGVPIAAPSANISGKPSPTTAEAVAEDMDGKIDMIIDGGPCDIGIESTVLDLSSDVPMILRPGEITLDMVRTVLPDCVAEQGLYNEVSKDSTPKCPGMKYKHYSPDAMVIVFEEGKENLINEYIEKYVGKKVAVYCKKGGKYNCGNIKYWGKDAADMAKNLFNDLRGFDKDGIEVVLCQAPEMSQMGQSVRNRLYKSAGYNIVK